MSDGRVLNSLPGLNRKRKEGTVTKNKGEGNRRSSPSSSREKAKGICTMAPLSTTVHFSGILLDHTSQRIKVVEAPLLCATLGNPVGHITRWECGDLPDVPISSCLT